MGIKTRNRAFINKNQQETHNMSGRILSNKKTRPRKSGSATYKDRDELNMPSRQTASRENFGLGIQSKDFKFYNRNEIENNSKRYSFFFQIKTSNEIIYINKMVKNKRRIGIIRIQ